MSGGSHEMGFIRVGDLYGDRMFTKELNEFVCDLCDLLKSVEWWRSGDTVDKDYYEDAAKFYEKWLTRKPPGFAEFKAELENELSKEQNMEG